MPVSYTHLDVYKRQQLSNLIVGLCLRIIKFLEIKPNSVDIKEAFIDFNPLEVKTAEGITEAITSKLELSLIHI